MREHNKNKNFGGRSDAGCGPLATYEIEALIAKAYGGAEDGARLMSGLRLMMWVQNGKSQVGLWGSHMSNKKHFIEDSGLVYLHNILHGPLVNSGEMACEIARLILRRFEGDQEAALEEPLQYRDDGDYWSVRGSHQPPDMAVGSGIWSISINKSNARVFDLGRKLTLKTPDELSPGFKCDDEGED